MSIDIGWRQSKDVRTNIMSLAKEILKEMQKLMILQNELLQMQVAKTEVIILPNMEVEVNETTIYEKKEEIKECELNIDSKLYTMEIALLDDSDLIFMSFNELDTKINGTESDLENCSDEIDELKGEMEEL